MFMLIYGFFLCVSLLYLTPDNNTGQPRDDGSLVDDDDNNNRV
jgi:hypothetical protein